MPYQYLTKFRRRVCDRLVQRESVKALVVEFSVSDASLFRWKRQFLVDLGQKAGVKSFEADDLTRAQRTIKELEAELELVKAASALINGEEVVRPKGSTRLRKR
jgi:transposase-like protein